MLKKWYQSPGETVLKDFTVNLEEGLSDNEVAKRMEESGPNQLQASKPINPFKLFLSQFQDALIIVLLVAAGVSLALGFVEEGGSVKESILIFAIVIAIALVGFFNEYKAEKTVEALRKLVGFKARVRRSGKTIEVDTVELVPGDIVLLEAGQKLPADIRLISVDQLQINEASLTGESLPVNKNADAVDHEVPLGDQKCMAFAGTFIASGTGTGIVVATGQKTEIGKIADMVNNVEEESTPMQKKLNDLGKKLGYFIAGICVLVFIIVFFLVPESREASTIHRVIFAFTAAVALAVAAIPEGLAFVVRISLALGARRMANKKALVRKLSAVEALGSTDVICSDKTGTLTKGEMTVRNLFVNGELVEVSGTGYETEGTLSSKKAKTESIEQLLKIGVLCNNSTLRDKTIIGDPTEGSLLVSAHKAKLNPSEILKALPRISEVPFTSERKLMTTIHKDGSNYFVALKGAVEITMEICSHYIDANGKVAKLDAKTKESILKKNQELASQALRVLAFAQKSVSSKPTAENAEEGLTFVGLQAMMDPPRTEVMEVIKRVQAEAGMRVIMITGDYLETAKAIATEIGITGDAISGQDLDKLEQAEFEERVESINVYARVNPEHKIRIVQALKKHGHQVAMTGDGVNDAPAIKAADIGIAMGITGTDVAKEASDLILLDDKFLTIINAIEEGRGIFDNVRKFVNFLISCNIAEVITIVMGIVFFNNLLLTAAQLLFINIVTDGLPAVALGSDPAESDVLKSKPARFQEAIVTRRVWAEIFIFGTLMSLLLVAQYWYNHTHESALFAVSAAFTAMVVYELVRLIDIRTDYKIKWFSNPWLTVAMVSSLALQLAVLYIPPLAHYFSVGPLNPHDWIIMGAGSVVLIVFMKLINRPLDRLMGHEIAT